MITHSKRLQKLYDDMCEFDEFVAEDIMYDNCVLHSESDILMQDLFEKAYELGKKNKSIYSVEAYCGDILFDKPENNLIKIFEKELKILQEDEKKSSIIETERAEKQLAEDLKNAEARVKALKEKVGKTKSSNV